MASIIRNMNIHELLLSTVTISRSLKFTSIQNFHTSSSFYAVNKLLLAKLRKNTGFSISHCKNALEINENDLDKSEEWLRKEAQAHGWAKASKLSSRATTQGLIGIHLEKNVGGLVEVNCETDFVAKNNDFKELVNNIVKAFTLSSSSHSETAEKTTKEFIDKSTLEQIQTAEGKSLAELVALTIGKVGENIRLTRGVKFTVAPDLELVGYVHPPTHPETSATLAGKYAAVVAFKNASNRQLARELCAHVTGMNPSSIGSLEELESSSEDTSSEESSSDEGESDTSSDEGKSDEDADEPAKEEVEKDEIVLVRQKFITNQDVKVGEVLRENNIEIVDFIRLECGETQKEQKE